MDPTLYRGKMVIIVVVDPPRGPITQDVTLQEVKGQDSLGIPKMHIQEGKVVDYPLKRKMCLLRAKDGF